LSSSPPASADNQVGPASPAAPEEIRMNMPPPLQEKSSTGLEPNVAAALAYLAWFVTGIVFLVLEKDSKFVKFHAMQSILLFLPLAVVQMVLWSIPFLGWLLGFFLWIASLVVWLVLMFKAYQGERFKLPVVGDIAEQQVR
jgi:uncharacterized membrane protein